MKTVEIAVCDDEQVHIDRIVKYIDVYSEESEININITSYNSGMALLKDIENDDLKYDITNWFTAQNRCLECGSKLITYEFTETHTELDFNKEEAYVMHYCPICDKNDIIALKSERR